MHNKFLIALLFLALVSAQRVASEEITLGTPNMVSLFLDFGTHEEAGDFILAAGNDSTDALMLGFDYVDPAVEGFKYLGAGQNGSVVRLEFEHKPSMQNVWRQGIQAAPFEIYLSPARDIYVYPKPQENADGRLLFAFGSPSFFFAALPGNEESVRKFEDEAGIKTFYIGGAGAASEKVKQDVVVVGDKPEEAKKPYLPPGVQEKSSDALGDLISKAERLDWPKYALLVLGTLVVVLLIGALLSRKKDHLSMARDARAKKAMLPSNWKRIEF